MITVLRLGHRLPRDVRTTTHCALVARAFGADALLYAGDADSTLEESVGKLVGKWGGKFAIKRASDWRKFLKEFLGVKVHLTMYGLPVQQKISEVRHAAVKRDLLVIIGAEKVPREAYEQSDYNLSVTSQPHSEVAALAVFLHEFLEGKELEQEFDGKVRITPAQRGKNVSKVAG